MITPPPQRNRGLSIWVWLIIGFFILFFILMIFLGIRSSIQHGRLISSALSGNQAAADVLAAEALSARNNIYYGAPRHHSHTPYIYF